VYTQGGAGKRVILEAHLLNKEFVFVRLQVSHLKEHRMPFIS
jgi:hypothetical protein